ncbi:MAG: hypothetical protein CSA83_02790 [Actinomycetales bacterium]|nr:MAG: hypothetical protein CSA83_02790 [Actinomycetales bacterium]
MKTTIELPDALAERAKLLANEQKTTLRELVTAGLERELDRRSAGSDIDFAWVTYDGQGIQIDPAMAISQSYELT